MGPSSLSVGLMWLRLESVPHGSVLWSRRVQKEKRRGGGLTKAMCKLSADFNIAYLFQNEHKSQPNLFTTGRTGRARWCVVFVIFRKQQDSFTQACQGFSEHHGKTQLSGLHRVFKRLFKDTCFKYFVKMNLKLYQNLCHSTHSFLSAWQHWEY